MADTVYEKCFHCGERKPDVSLRSDPYVLELGGEEWEINICDQCYDMRSDEV